MRWRIHVARRSEALDGLTGSAEHAKHGGSFVVGVGIIGTQTQGDASLGQGVGGTAGETQHISETAMPIGHIRPKAKGNGIDIGCLGVLAQRGECIPQRHETRHRAGLQASGLASMVEGRGGLVLLQQCERKIAVRFGEAGPQTRGLPPVFQGLGTSAKCVQGVAKVIVPLGKTRLDREPRGTKGLNRIGDTAHTLQGDAVIEQETMIGRPQLQRTLDVG